MKIGIITFWKSNDNYGQILQAFALYKFLELKGHECFIIKYMEERNSTFFSRIITLFKLLFSVRKIKAFITAKRKQTLVEEIEEDRSFDAFRNKCMKFSKEYLHTELMNHPPEADAYVCGSDQIWGSLDSNMYLSFAPKQCMKIAFSPSFGGLQPDWYVKKRIKKYIDDFDLVSCRESSGVELCKSLGRRDALHFPDPTLMHKADFYDKLITEFKPKKSYIFVYLLGNEMNFNTDTIFDFARENKLEIVFVTGQSGKFDIFEKYPARIEEWIAGIKNAEYVITNSFHGTVFSIIYHKKFITIPLSGIHKRMNVRINELLEKYYMQERIYSGNLNDICKDVDFSTFDSMQDNDIERVNNALKDIL